MPQGVTCKSTASLSLAAGSGTSTFDGTALFKSRALLPQILKRNDSLGGAVTINTAVCCLMESTRRATFQSAAVASAELAPVLGAVTMPSGAPSRRWRKHRIAGSRCTELRRRLREICGF